MSSSSVVSLSSFNLLFFTQVLTVLTSTVKYNEYVTDKGKNISIPCIADGSVMWVKENDAGNSTIIQSGKFLVLTNVSTADRGLYVCFAAVPSSRNATPTSSADETSDDAATTETKSAATEADATASKASLAPLSAKAALATTSSAFAIAMTVSTTSPTPPSSAAAGAAAPTATVSSALAASISSITTTRTASATTIHHHPQLPPPATTTTTAPSRFDDELEFQAFQKINLNVRTPPGPVTQLYFKASTILGFLIWRFNKTNSGGYPVRSFTAEFRNISYSSETPPYNSSYEHEWSRMDPINIAPNVRQMEVYRLEPNTTYEFRIWANNHLGSGEVVTTNVTTLPETKEEDLIRLIQPDLDNFDPRVWIAAVSVVLGTLVILAIGLCIVLSKECYQASHMDYEDGWDSIELIPNIILNPGFCESDGQAGRGPYPRTVIFGGDDDSYTSSESDHEPRMAKFKRKVSVFFQGPTIQRI